MPPFRQLHVVIKWTSGYLFVPGQNGTRVTMIDARTGAILISRCERGSV
jgi:hypothetical protein